MMSNTDINLNLSLWTYYWIFFLNAFRIQTNKLIPDYIDYIYWNWKHYLASIFIYICLLCKTLKSYLNIRVTEMKDTFRQIVYTVSNGRVTSIMVKTTTQMRFDNLRLQNFDQLSFIWKMCSKVRHITRVLIR